MIWLLHFVNETLDVVLTNLCSIFSIFKVFWSGHDLFWSNVEQGWIVHGFCSGSILKKCNVAVKTFTVNDSQHRHNGSLLRNFALHCVKLSRWTPFNIATMGLRNFYVLLNVVITFNPSTFLEPLAHWTGPQNRELRWWNKFIFDWASLSASPSLLKVGN